MCPWFCVLVAVANARKASGKDTHCGGSADVLFGMVTPPTQSGCAFCDCQTGPHATPGAWLATLADGNRLVSRQMNRRLRTLSRS